MTLGDIIVDYRTDHDISQRQFAQLCGLSNGYISMLEAGEHPKTKRPIIPSLSVLKKITGVIGISLTDLFDMIDDIQLDLSSDSESDYPTGPLFHSLVDLFNQLNDDGQDKLLEYADDLVASKKYSKSRSADQRRA